MPNKIGITIRIGRTIHKILCPKCGSKYLKVRHVKGKPNVGLGSTIWITCIKCRFSKEQVMCWVYFNRFGSWKKYRPRPRVIRLSLLSDESPVSPKM